MDVKVESERLKEYLLGLLDADGRQEVETRLMVDSDFFEELQRREYELIDDYLSRGLTRTEKKRFESFFLLDPERQQKLRFSRALKHYVALHPVTDSSGSAGWVRWRGFRLQNPVLGWSLAAVLVLAIFGGILSMFEISRLRRTLLAVTVDTQKLLTAVEKRNAELAAALQQEQSRRHVLEQQAGGLRSEEAPGLTSLHAKQTNPNLFVLALSPGLLRDVGSSRKTGIPHGTDLVELDLSLASVDHVRYQAVLQRVDEGEIWTQVSPKPDSQGRLLHLIVPANLLTPGDYVTKVSGIGESGAAEHIGSYYFRIIPNRNQAPPPNR